MERQMHSKRQASVFNALGLALLGLVTFGYTVYHYDYFWHLQRGANGKAAIQLLDEMRRPFLAMKQAELNLLQPVQDASSVTLLESAIREGQHKLAAYLELAQYNADAYQKVLKLKASYESWVALELEMAHMLASSSGAQTEPRKREMLANKNTAAFLQVMDVLGEGEHPIHRDIEAGASAARGLLISSLSLIAYLIALVFWREWSRRERERQYYESELRLNRLALTDSLTGLANRMLLDDRLSLAIAKARRYKNLVAIMYLDLDGFKAINDEMGHEVGDVVLQEVAARLKQHTREMDTVARVGGDEFVILATELSDKDEAHLFADKLQRALLPPFVHGGKQYSLRASLGVSLFPDNGELPAELIKLADAAMYEAKRKSKSSQT